MTVEAPAVLETAISDKSDTTNLVMDGDNGVAALPRQRESAMLVLQRGSEAGRRWPLDRTRPLTIGRSEECDIVLPDRQVSRYHARISWAGDHFQVEDLGSGFCAHRCLLSNEPAGLVRAVLIARPCCGSRFVRAHQGRPPGT